MRPEAPCGALKAGARDAARWCPFDQNVATVSTFAGRLAGSASGAAPRAPLLCMWPSKRVHADPVQHWPTAHLAPLADGLVGLRILLFLCSALPEALGSQLLCAVIYIIYMIYSRIKYAKEKVEPDTDSPIASILGVSSDQQEATNEECEINDVFTNTTSAQEKADAYDYNKVHQGKQRQAV